MRVEHYPGVADIIHLDDTAQEQFERDIARVERGQSRFRAALLVLAILSFIAWVITRAYI